MDAAQSAAPASTVQTDPKGTDDLGRKRRLFRAFEDNKRREIEEQKRARRYYAGVQWEDADAAKLARRGQPVIWDNKIERKINALVGVEQRMRGDPKGVARGPKDEQAADLVTACLRFVCDECHWDAMASDGAHDGLVSGIGVLWVGAGMTPGKNQVDVQLKRGQVDRFFYDPRSTLPDFSDARYMGMHLWLDVDDVKAEYPDQAGNVSELLGRDNGMTLSVQDQDRNEQWGDFERNRIRIVEMYERKPSPTGNGYAWWFTKFSGSIAFEDMWSPYLDENGVPDCPYVAWSPNVDHRGDRYGMCRNMIPLQDEVNHRRSKLLHLANTNQLQMNPGLVDDVDQTRHEMAKPDGVIVHQGEWGKNVGPTNREMDFKGHADLLLQAQSSLENMGPNPGIVGNGGGVADQSGYAINLQQNSGLNELSPIFRRLRNWKLRVYRKIWGRILHTWKGERYIRVTEDEKAPSYVRVNGISNDPMTGAAKWENPLFDLDVDVILDEGPDVIVSRQELLNTITQLGPNAMGPLGEIIVELSPVNNKEMILSKMRRLNEPPPEVAQLQKDMAYLKAEVEKANVAKMHAETENKRADTYLKMIQAMMPPQQLQSQFPIMFQDTQMQGAAPQQQPMPMQAPQQMPMPQMDQQPMEQTPDMMPGGLPISGELASGMSNGIAGQ